MTLPTLLPTLLPTPPALAGLASEASARADHDLIQPTPFVVITPQPLQRPPRLPPGIWKYIAAALATGITIYYIATARSVAIDITPGADRVDISGGLHLHWRGVHLLWSGRYRLMASRAGYETLDVPLSVTTASVQRVRFNLQKLGGYLRVVSTPVGALLSVDGVARGATPIASLVLPPGAHDVGLSALDYAPYSARINVLGQGRRETLQIELKPQWAWVSVTTTPAGAQVRLGERVLGVTTGRVRVPQGERLLTVKLKGYKVRQQRVHVAPGIAQQLPPLALERADGLIEVRTQPADAAVSVDGQYRGQSPLELALPPGRAYQLSFLKPGYRRVERSATPQAEGEFTINVGLAPEQGNLILAATPADAQVFIDGKPHGAARQTVTLDTRPHDVEIRKAGYVGYRERITPRPDFPQEIRVTLVSTEVARRTSTAKQLVTATGQKMRLIFPGAFTMGSGPRDPGHRPNETQHEVTLTRPYYLGVLEITNAEYRKFQAQHTSGKFLTVDLNDDKAPAVNLSWFNAARYCNWLSAQERLPPFYDIGNGTPQLRYLRIM